MYLVDTNMLLRLLQPEQPHYEPAKSTIHALLSDQQRLVIVPQVSAEFWNVCTRPKDKNGLGLDREEAKKRLDDYEKTFTLCRDVPAIYGHWRKLVEHYDVKGVQAHDTRLVAAMLAHGLTHILTFNANDFKRFKEITAVQPHLVEP